MSSEYLKKYSTSSVITEMRIWASLVRICIGVLTMQETWVRSPGWEDSLENRMSTHYYCLFWPGEFHGQKNLAGYSPWGNKSNVTKQLTFSLNEYLKVCEIPLHNQQNV